MLPSRAGSLLGKSRLPNIDGATADGQQKGGYGTPRPLNLGSTLKVTQSFMTSVLSLGRAATTPEPKTHEPENVRDSVKT